MKTFKPFLLALAFAATAPFAISAHAQAMDHSKMGGMNMPGMKMDGMLASMTEGEVHKVETEAKKIHRPGGVLDDPQVKRRSVRGILN